LLILWWSPLSSSLSSIFFSYIGFHETLHIKIRNCHVLLLFQNKLIKWQFHEMFMLDINRNCLCIGMESKVDIGHGSFTRPCSLHVIPTLYTRCRHTRQQSHIIFGF
jgi:hypothetical protein